MDASWHSTSGHECAPVAAGCRLAIRTAAWARCCPVRVPPVPLSFHPSRSPLRSRRKDRRMNVPVTSKVQTVPRHAFEVLSKKKVDGELQ